MTGTESAGEIFGYILRRWSSMTEGEQITEAWRLGKYFLLPDCREHLPQIGQILSLWFKRGKGDIADFLIVNEILPSFLFQPEILAARCCGGTKFFERLVLKQKLPPEALSPEIALHPLTGTKVNVLEYYLTMLGSRWFSEPCIEKICEPVSRLPGETLLLMIDMYSGRKSMSDLERDMLLTAEHTLRNEVEQSFNEEVDRETWSGENGTDGLYETICEDAERA